MQALASLVVLALLLGGVAAARAIAYDVPAPRPTVESPADAIAGSRLSLPKAVEAQPLRPLAQTPKRDPRPDDGTLPLLIALLAAVLLLPLPTGATGRVVPRGVMSPIRPPRPRQHGPTGPPCAA